MERLPDELLLRVLKHVDGSAQQLVELEHVCRRFYRITQDASLWYQSFASRYPIWSRDVSFATTHHLINWKDFVLNVSKQNRRAKSFVFDFVPDETHKADSRAARQHTASRKRKLTDRDSIVLSQDDVLEYPSDDDLTDRPTSPSTGHKSLHRQRLSPNLDTTHSSSSAPSPAHPMDIQYPSDRTFFASPSTSNPLHTVSPTDSPLLFSSPMDLARARLSLRDGHSSQPGIVRFFPPLNEIDDEPFLSFIHPAPYRIQDPLVVDVDRVTKRGVVATGKHRKEGPVGFHYLHHQQRSEHKILFWEYPSWRLIREFDLSFAPADMSCQITGIQTICMPTESGVEKIRLFSLAIGNPLPLQNPGDLENDDRVDLWQVLLVYRLFDDGTTQCIAHLNLDGKLLGREVFFFSERSWAQSNDGDCPVTDRAESVKDWLSILAPEYADYDPRFTIFMLAMGPVYPSIRGFCQLIRCDVRGQPDLLDPAIEPVIWDSASRQFRSTFGHYSGPSRGQQDREYGPPARVIANMPLGRKASCMIHFRYPPQLNHLICTGSYVQDELSVYDWRFGIKVGVLPWKHVVDEPEEAAPQASREPQDAADQDELANERTFEMHLDEAEIFFDDGMGDIDDFDFEMDDEDQNVVRPWGLESTMVLPPYGSNAVTASQLSDLATYGFRLIAVGDNRRDKLEIKVWDISYLLRARWRILEDRDQVDENFDEEGDWSHRFIWWKRGTPCLKRFALRMIYENKQPFQSGSRTSRLLRRNLEKYKALPLPYSPPDGAESMILVHAFDCNVMEDSVMPVKYTAYNVLRTSLFLLTEEGRITVMDIETGQVIGTVDNVAALPGIVGPQRRVHGIDVNVVGGSDIVVTSRQGLLRGTML